MRSCDLQGVIVTARVDDQFFIGEIDAFQARFQLRTGIEGNEDDGNGLGHVEARSTEAARA